MDKNHSQIFIIWDKLFGTFQEELDSVPPVFGITRPAQTWNPFRINFQHLWLLITDAWRPKNGKTNSPFGSNLLAGVPKILKKNTLSTKSRFMLLKNTEHNIPTINVLVTISSHNHFIAHHLHVQFDCNYWFTKRVHLRRFYILNVYSYTELMDTRKISLLWEGIRFFAGIAIIAYLGDWFGMNMLFPFASYIIIGYLVFVFIGHVLFCKHQF